MLVAKEESAYLEQPHYRHHQLFHSSHVSHIMQQFVLVAEVHHHRQYDVVVVDCRVVG